MIFLLRISQQRYFQCTFFSYSEHVNEVTLNEQNVQQKSCQTFKSKLFMLRRLRSFQRGTVGLCRSTGFKVTSCHIWRFEKNSAIQPTSNHTSAARVRFPDDRIILQLWKLVTLQPVDLQRPTASLWKDLNLLNINNFNLEDKNDFQYKFCSVKVTHFNSTYVMA